MTTSATAPPTESLAPTTREQSVALTRDLAEFLIELAIALHQHAIYPAGHPLATTGARRVGSRLLVLLADRPFLTFGVARRQLVIEGVLTDPAHPLLQDLALRFNRVDIGAVRIDHGVAPAEIAAFLDWVARRDERLLRESAAGAAADEREREWVPLGADRITLFRHSYEQLDLVEGERASTGGNLTRTAGLWVGLAQAALTGSGVEEQPADADPVVVARVIDDHTREEAYDQVIVGYLAQIADELRVGDTAEQRALQRRVSKLVRALDDATLQQLLTMGGNGLQRRGFALSAAQAFSSDALLDVVRAAAAASGQTISHSLVRVLSKLAAHAEQDATSSHPSAADDALRANVRALIESWQLADPNPTGYRDALEALAAGAPADNAAPAAADDANADAERIAAMCLELDVDGTPLEAAVNRLADHGLAERVAALLAGAPADSTTAVAAAWGILGAPARVRRLAGDTSVSVATVARAATHAGEAATRALLDELAESESRRSRARLLELLPALGPSIAAEVVRRLVDAPWYVQRNLLAVLHALGETPAEFAVAEWITHADPRVRREALRIALRDGRQRDRAIAVAVRDPDSRVVHLALAGAEANCSRRAAAAIRRAVDDGAMAGEIRALALRAAAAATDDPPTRPWLLGFVVGEGRWRAGRRLLRKSPDQLAALGALRAHWADDSEGADVLALALASADPDVRAAAASYPTDR